MHHVLRICLCMLCVLSGLCAHADSLRSEQLARQLSPYFERVYETARFTTNTSPVRTPVWKEQQPWQVALFLAARNRSIEETLTDLRVQLNWGNLALAVVLDVTPHAPVPEKKLACESRHCTQTQLQSPAYATLYILYRANGLARQEKKELPLTQDVGALWEALLRQFKRGQGAYHTGVIIDAHSGGSWFHYGKEGLFSSKELMDIFARHRLHVDVLELDSCYMASLQNVYQWSKQNTVDYVVASSDAMYTSSQFMYYRLLRFLHEEPVQAAIHSVQDRLKHLQFASDYDTNNSAALDLRLLRKPLLRYAETFKELFFYVNTQELWDAFASHFRTEDTDWHSLENIVRRQRQYVAQHLRPDLKNFYASQMRFVRACDALLEALPASTLTRWCYSSATRKVYRNNAPAWIGCLSSVSTTRSQLWSLWE